MVSSAFDNEGNIWISFSGKEDPMDDPHDARPATEAEPMPFDEFYDAELYKYSPNGTVVCSTPGSLGQSGGPPHYDPELDLVFWGGRDQSNGAVVTPDCNTAAELTCYTRGGIEVWPGAGADGYVRLGENVYSTCGAALSFWQRLNENNSDWRMFHEQFYPVHEDYSAVEFGGLSTDGELLFVSSAASSWYAVQPTSNQTRLLALNAATGLKKWEVNWQYSSPNPCQAGIPVSAPKQSMVLFAHDSPTVVSGISTVSGSIKWNWTVSAFQPWASSSSTCGAVRAREQRTRPDTRCARPPFACLTLCCSTLGSAMPLAVAGRIKVCESSRDHCARRVGNCSH